VKSSTRRGGHTDIHCATIDGLCWQGHKIKNPRTLISTQLRRVPVAVAVIISGTPIQNNLMELFALFDFVHPVPLLPLPHPPF
jgi:hypothetical protein